MKGEEYFVRNIGPLDGIIVHERCVAFVTSSGRDDDWCDEKDVVDLQDGSEFCSVYDRKSEDISDERNNWLCYDFKDRRIIPSHYSIRTSGYWNLQNWVVEVSGSGEKWTEIDSRMNNSDLNGVCFTATFSVSKTCECRMIRLVNVGRNWSGDDSLWICAWEIFGNLIK
jgi:hypothetical protein